MEVRGRDGGCPNGCAPSHLGRGHIIGGGCGDGLGAADLGPGGLPERRPRHTRLAHRNNPFLTWFLTPRSGRGLCVQVEAYLDLLNQWKLWHVRARTEALLNSASSASSGALAEAGPSLPPQVCSHSTLPSFVDRGRS